MGVAASQRSEQLARQFEAANAEGVATIEGLTAEQWRSTCADVGWSIGVAAHHIAVNYSITCQVAQAIAAGQAPGLTWEVLHEANAKHAAEHADTTKEETLEILSTDGERAAAAIRGFSDEELNRTGYIPFLGPDPVSVAGFIEAIVIGHISMHLPGIKAAAGS